MSVPPIDDETQECFQKAKQAFENHNLEEGRALASASIQLAQKENNTDIEANSNELIGESYLLNGSNEKAKEYFERAWFLYKDYDVRKGLRALSCLVRVFCCLGYFNKALVCAYELIEYCERFNDKQQKARALNSMAIIFRRLENYEKALEISLESLEIKKEIKDKEGIANGYINIGNIYKYFRDQSQSLQYYRKALDYYKRIGKASMMAACYINIAEAHLQQNHYKRAEQSFRITMELASKTQSHAIMFYALCGMGKISLIQKEEGQAIDYYLRSLTMAENAQDKDMLLTVYRYLTEYYKKNRDFEKAFEYCEKHKDLAVELFSVKLSDKIAMDQAKFDYKQKQKEASHYRSENQELKITNHIIETQKLQLEEINNEKDNIINIVSHDLKNSLMSIHWATEIIENCEIKDKVRHYVQYINTSLRKADYLVNNILDAHKLELSDFELELQANCIQSVLKGYEEELRMIAKNKQIECIFEYDNEDLTIELNTDRFWQIIGNLFSNAVKFTPIGGKIVLTVQKGTDNTCVLTIKDTGIGISRSEQAIIFNRFTKAGRLGTEGEKSIGLGLSIVRRVVELHKGSINVESVVNQGSTFILCFPLYTTPNKQ